MHLVKAARSCVLFGVWVEKRGTSGSHSLSEWSVFLCFHSEMWKLLHRGIIVFSEEKTPLSWFKGRSNEMSYVLDQVCVSMIWTLFLVCDTMVAFFFIVWHFYMGKIQSAKQGNLRLTFCFSGVDEFYSSLPYRMSVLIKKKKSFNSLVFNILIYPYNANQRP